MNRSNNDHEAQALAAGDVIGRWTDEGLPLSLRRKLLRQEIEEVRGETGKPAVAAGSLPARPGRHASRERAG